MSSSFSDLPELAKLFNCQVDSSTDTGTSLSSVKVDESDAITYFKIPDIVDIELGYCKTWVDLIPIQVPLNPVPQALLLPRVPLPLHHQNPRNILTKIDKGWWDRVRQQVYQSQNYHCACCGIHKAYQLCYPKVLDAHEVYKIDYKTGIMQLKGIIPVCRACHMYIHWGRTTALYNAGKLSERDYFAIIAHGNRVLQGAGLPIKDTRDATVDDNTYNIPWDNWKLELNISGSLESYYSLYKDQEDLEAHY